MSQIRVFSLFLSLSQVSAAGNCVTENAACLVGQSNLLAEYNKTNSLGCIERCHFLSDCLQWTWWYEEAVCQLFSSCDDFLDEEFPKCESGSRSCGEVGDYVAVVSGGLSGDHYNQDSVIALNEKKICSQPAFWSGMSVMPRHRWGHVTTFMETVFIVCGGTTDLEGIFPNNTCDAYNLSSRSWEEFDDMLELRHQASGASALGNFYVSGGYSEAVTIVDTMEAYDPFYSRTWTNMPSMPLALAGHCMLQYRDSLVVVGGTTAAQRESARILSFNITTNLWADLGNLSQPRVGHGCSLIERKNAVDIIVTGGKNNGDTLKSAENITITPLTFTVKQITSLPVRISNHVQIDNGRTRIIGGDVSNVERDFILEFQNPTWTMTNVTLPRNLAYHHVTRYPANLVKC